MSLNELEEKALKFATEAHKGQLRKYTNEPYIVHPVAVAELVKAVDWCTSEMVAAALLHDTVEDTEVTLQDIYREFGFVISEMVDHLTDISKPEDGNREKRKKLDREHIAKSDLEVKTIKLADLIDNSRTISRYDPKFWKVYRIEKLKLLDVLKEGDGNLWEIAFSQVWGSLNGGQGRI